MTVKSLTFADCFNLGVADAKNGIPRKVKSRYSVKQLQHYNNGYSSVSVASPKPEPKLTEAFSLKADILKNVTVPIDLE